MMIVEVATTKKKEIIDLTSYYRRWLPNPQPPDGICHRFLLHTTAALTTADLDPGTELDLLDAFDALVPKLDYRHLHDPRHVPDHILSSLLGTSLTVPIKGGQALLGEWQRIVLVEFDGPRDRKIAVTFVADNSTTKSTQ